MIRDTSQSSIAPCEPCEHAPSADNVRQSFTATWNSAFDCGENATVESMKCRMFTTERGCQDRTMYNSTCSPHGFWLAKMMSAKIIGTVCRRLIHEDWILAWSFNKQQQISQISKKSTPRYTIPVAMTQAPGSLALSLYTRGVTCRASY